MEVSSLLSNFCGIEGTFEVCWEQVALFFIIGLTWLSALNWIHYVSEKHQDSKGAAISLEAMYSLGLVS